MTETVYSQEIKTFTLTKKVNPVFEINLLSQGITALELFNKQMGLAMDEWDLQYYFRIFTQVIKRNPTNIECFDLAQSNSEHSRHWFFRGDISIDEKKMDQTLFDMIIDTRNHSNNNNVIAFSDNSSAIIGHYCDYLRITDPQQVSKYKLERNIQQHICFTAETHNFPTGVAPFPGAATGTGGRIRDVQAVGRGGKVIAGIAGYCFGNLHIPGFIMEWEDKSNRSEPIVEYPTNLAKALEVAIEASNGASDYGNKFGEPVIVGFARSYGDRVSCNDREWREWIKPIMFSGGIGQLSSQHVNKAEPKTNQLVVKLGGPIYRIGVGGGAASSVIVQGDSASRHSDLDFGAVQRGDAQMENKLNRVLLGCIDLGSDNPILSIHDQGAGGNGNVLKELVDPLGAEIDGSAFQLGDATINILELWGAEYQESNGLLIDEKNVDLLQSICDRERCPMCLVGKVTGTGKVKLRNWPQYSQEHESNGKYIEYPVDLDLSVVLGKMPRKQFSFIRKEGIFKSLELPVNLKIQEALSRVLRLPAVASKRFLTNKVDRSVTGLVAQQQCVGPLHTPLADAGVIAMSYFNYCGAVTAVGEQPIKMLLNPLCGARMSLVECLTNMGSVGGTIDDIRKVKLSGNWMWPAKMSGEGAKLWDACVAVCSLMKRLGVAIDGGKDSLSMAATAQSYSKGAGELSTDCSTSTVVVKAPGSLVISGYVDCGDIRTIITPDLKGNGKLVWIRFSQHQRVGGTALAQVFNQLGDECPDLSDDDEVELFKITWSCIQSMISQKLISACHDISDGGVICCLLEMAFAGNIGINCNFINTSSNNDKSTINLLFNEEPGWIVEIPNSYWSTAQTMWLDKQSLLYNVIGTSGGQYETDPLVTINVNNNNNVMNNVKLGKLRHLWEETSYHLEKQQCNEACVEEEYKKYADPQLTQSPYKLSEIHDSYWSCVSTEIESTNVAVAILREEGSNGDKEMAASFMRAGFECWDVTMQDLLNSLVDLEKFTGLVFVGGFSYGDVLGAGKGWAASILCNSNLAKQFAAFRERKDTFSLGICNGCQLMMHLGWVSSINKTSSEFSTTIQLKKNDSGRFESRFSTVSVPRNTNSIMLNKLRGCHLGVWVSHGEGKFQFENESYLTELKSHGQIALEYATTTPNKNQDDILEYPTNPNGSTANIAALVSKDGRHLAMMPHPERSVMWWQWPYTSDLDIQRTTVSPWQLMFNDALVWAQKNKS